MSAIRVVIADDHQVVREGLRQLLEREPDIRIVAEAGTGKEALGAAESARPDVLLLDLRMPDGDGRSVMAEMAARNLPTRVLALTGHAEPEEGEELLQLGARGFAMKSTSTAELVQAIRAVHAGEIWADRPTLSRFIDRLNGSQTLPARPRPILSQREREILEAVGRGQNNQQIAHRLFISENTVKAHLSRIFRKLEVADRTQAVVAGLEQGFIRGGHC
jgi:DNA-binding NarL/FixJ family response regulator